MALQLEPKQQRAIAELQLEAKEEEAEVEERSYLEWILGTAASRVLLDFVGSGNGSTADLFCLALTSRTTFSIVREEIGKRLVLYHPPHPYVASDVYASVARRWREAPSATRIESYGNACHIVAVDFHENADNWSLDAFPKLTHVTLPAACRIVEVALPRTLTELVCTVHSTVAKQFWSSVAQNLPLLELLRVRTPTGTVLIDRATVFPSNLSTLYLSGKYVIAPHVLPLALRKFHLKDRFASMPYFAENVLPKGLRTLVCGSTYGGHLRHVPGSVRKLKVSAEAIIANADGALPSRLRKLQFYRIEWDDMLEFFATLDLRDTFVKKLYFSRKALRQPNLTAFGSASFGEGRLPVNSLEQLVMPDYIRIPLQDLPSLRALQRITGGVWDAYSLAHLPPTLGRLSFSTHRCPCSSRIAQSLPIALEKLELFGEFNRPPLGLPIALRSLVLGDNFNAPLMPGSLPSSLRTLRLGYRFNQCLEPGILPDRLTNLDLSKCVKFAFPLGASGDLPRKLHTISLHVSYVWHPCSKYLLEHRRVGQVEFRRENESAISVYLSIPRDEEIP